MITYVTGVPRSGKSYYVVNYIKNNYSKFDTVFTNINGFKFDKLPNTKKIHFDDFLEDYIKELYSLYKQYKKEFDDYDEKLLEKLSNDGYEKCLFVIDECQEYLQKELVHIKWLMSYHGHLRFEFIFATQNLPLVHAKYKATIEGVIKAIPSTLKLFSKSLVYYHYATTRMTKSDVFDKTTLIKKDEVFKLFKSGDIVKGGFFLFKPILVLIILLVFVYFSYQNFMSSTFTNEEPKNNIENDNKATVTTNTTINESITLKNINQNFIYDVYCSKKKCSFNNYKKIPIDLFLFKQIDLYKIRYEYQANYGKHFYVEANESFETYFQNFKVESKEPGFISGVINSPLESN